MEEYREYLKGQAKRRLRWPERVDLDPSELAQETLTRAHSRRHQFRGTDGPSLRAWLRRVLWRLIADRLRRTRLPLVSGNSSRAHLDTIPAGRSTPSQQAIRAETSRRLKDALGRLPPDQATALQLHYLEGHSVLETAQRMGRTRPAVAGLIRRGLAGLRGDLRDEGEETTS